MKKVVIVGAGIGGLVAGNLLAKKGHKVTIFEARSKPGGYVGGFYRKGYYFENGAVSLGGSASIFKVLQDIGVLEKIDFVRLGIRFVAEDFDVIPENYDNYKEAIYSSFPSDKEKLDKAFEQVDIMVNFILESLDQPTPSVNSGFKKAKLLLPYILNGPKLLKLSKQYPNIISTEFIARYFHKDSTLFKLFSYGHLDMPAMLSGTPIAAIISDYWTVKSGMQAWVDILAENFRQLGGELRLSSYVDRIITKNSVAVGVSCKNTVYNADYVISAGDYKKTFLKLLDAKQLIAQEIQDKIKNAPVSEGFFLVFLGLDMSNTELAKYLKVPYVFSFDEKPGYDIYNSADPEYFSKAAVTYYSWSMINPQHAPEGKSSLMLRTMVPHHWMNNWGGGDKQVYKQLKEKAMDAVIERASTLIPCLQERIEYRDAATPLTFERFTQNTDGAMGGWSWNPNKTFYKNNMDGNIETPVKNLYIGSCWAMQTGGLLSAHMVGYQCAKRIK